MYGRPLQRFPWRFAVYFILGLYLFADMILWRGPVHRKLTQPWTRLAAQESEIAAIVYGRPITRLELAEALRRHLWERSQDWESLSPTARQQTRTIALETLVNQRILHAFRSMNRIRGSISDISIQQELDQLQSQFPDQQEWQQRLAMQALTTTSLQQQTRLNQETALWIEEKIQHRIAEITPEQIRAYYDLHLEDLTIPQRYRARHLYLSSHDPDQPDNEKKIQQLHRDITLNPERLPDLIAAHSDDERSKVRQGDLLWFSSHRMPSAFTSAVQKLRPNEISPPVRTELGWHIIQLMETRPARHPSLEEVRDEIQSLLEDERRQLALHALIQDLRRRSRVPTSFVQYFQPSIDSVEPAPRR
jgi:parvulin-like peptidyl-prolyl isomerase